MTWGPLMMYYHCPKCDVMGIYEKEGPRLKDDSEYFEVE